jgi:hypothetical protein
MDHYDAGSESPGIDELTLKVLKVFGEMGSESLDLHTLFDAGGNDPQSLERVLYVITRLVDAVSWNREVEFLRAHGQRPQRSP